MLIHTLWCTTHYSCHVSLVLFPCPLARAACYVGGLRVRHAKCYGSKSTVSRDGVALNVLGYFTLRARPLANHSMSLKRNLEAWCDQEFRLLALLTAEPTAQTLEPCKPHGDRTR